jgi:hypothetical protein
MIECETTFVVQNLTAREITEFMLSCNDELYREWWSASTWRFKPSVEDPGRQATW